jgi:DNA-directed RNA polymerase subunit L
MFEHKESAGHKEALKLLAEDEKETLPNVLVKTLAREKEITSEIFRTAYKVAKENQSFHNFEAEIDLQ